MTLQVQEDSQQQTSPTLCLSEATSNANYVLASANCSYAKLTFLCMKLTLLSGSRKLPSGALPARVLQLDM